MPISIAPFKLNFASWLRTNACKKGLLLIVLLIKLKLVLYYIYDCFFRIFVNVWFFVSDVVLKMEKFKLMMVYQALAPEEIVKQKIGINVSELVLDTPAPGFTVYT